MLGKNIGKSIFNICNPNNIRYTTNELLNGFIKSGYYLNYSTSTGNNVTTPTTTHSSKKYPATGQHKKEGNSLYEYDTLTEKNVIVGGKKQTNYFVYGDTKLEDILSKKNIKGVLSVKVGSLIIDAVRKMVDNKVGSVLVVNEKNHIKGIFTERDYVGKVLLAGLSSRVNKIEEVMTTNVKSVNSDAGVVETMKLMTQEKFRHIPVLDKKNKTIIGVISIQDLLKEVQRNQKETIKYLREYVSDTSSYSVKGNK